MALFKRKKVEFPKVNYYYIDWDKVKTFDDLKTICQMTGMGKGIPEYYLNVFPRLKDLIR